MFLSAPSLENNGVRYIYIYKGVQLFSLKKVYAWMWKMLYPYETKDE